jgi:hypothetical protein
VPASLATVHERPCLQKELAVEDTEQVLNKVDEGDSETDHLSKPNLVFSLLIFIYIHKDKQKHLPHILLIILIYKNV